MRPFGGSLKVDAAEIAAIARKPCRKLTVIAYSVATLAVLAAITGLYFARPILLPIAIAFIISLLLRPPAEWFDRRGAAESASAAFLTLLVVAAFFSAVYFGAKPALAWFNRLPEVIAEAEERLEGVTSAFRRVNEVTQSVEQGLGVSDASETPAVRLRERSLAMEVTDSVQGIFVQIALTSVLIYFFLATRHASRRKALALRRSFGTRRRSARILARIEHNVVAYMLTMLAINTSLGIAVGVAIALIGGPNPIIFGILAGVLNFVPYIGPAIVSLLLLVTGLVNQDDLLLALAPVGAYIALNFIESNFVTPSLIGARARVSPLAIILFIAAFTWLWGPAGAIVAIPFLVILKTLCDSIETLRPVGILLSENVEPRRVVRRRRQSILKAA